MDETKRYFYCRSMNCAVIFIFLLSISLNCQADKEKEEEPPRIGNFVLPFSQQPGPLIGFGQNILDKNEKQLFLLADDFTGVNRHFIDVIPSILYGISDDLSIFISVPIAASFKVGSQTSSGLEDILAQLEYAFYNHSTSTYSDQATLVGNITFPTGSIHKQPPTGLGAPSFFLGATYNRTYVKWFLFGSPGMMLTTSKGRTKFGNNYLYQFGFGRNIADPDGWLIAWMAELDGTYATRDRVSGLTDRNSGGNIIYLTPSIWASTKYLIIQFGVGYPVIQNLYGDQSRSTFVAAVNFGWSIY